MAKKSSALPLQNYPRIQDEDSQLYGYLDDLKLKQHKEERITTEDLRRLIRESIKSASKKSSRQVISIPDGTSPEDEAKVYEKEGRELLKYFRRYYGDPAATAHQLQGRFYNEVGAEQFRNKTLQRERMNSGWRYQYLANKAATLSGRFKNVSDISSEQADFHAVIEVMDAGKPPVVLYVSVKNRSNTMGGQDWPPAIQALEAHAKNDKNKEGPYCCVFGIVMEHGQRSIRSSNKTKIPYSYNTEIWFSDFFWPFFTNYSYEEIMTAVLDVLIESYKPDEVLEQVEVPPLVLESFGKACKEEGLIDEAGRFHDPHKLVLFFCRPPARAKRIGGKSQAKRNSKKRGE